MKPAIKKSLKKTVKKKSKKVPETHPLDAIRLMIAKLKKEGKFKKKKVAWPKPIGRGGSKVSTIRP